MGVIALGRHNQVDVEGALEQVAREHSLTGVFNPSVLRLGDVTLAAFRAESVPGERPFRGMLLVLASQMEPRLLDLTALVDPMDFAAVADPKLVRLGDAVYATFNTGTPLSGSNTLAIMRVWPDVCQPQRCVFADRHRVEKNWAFFEREGRVRALYSLQPPRVIELRSGELGERADLLFDEVTLDVATGGRNDSWHIGSQLAFATEDRAYLVAHRKVKIPKWNAYFARIARIDFDSGLRVRWGSHILIHSWRALRPRRKRPNRRLLFATYFSGLQVERDEVILSYGINDLAFGVARVPLRKVWGRA